MTKEELSKISLRFVSHLNMEHEHCSTYVNEDYGISMCCHTKVNKYGDFGRTYRHYMYKGVVYKSLPKFLEAMKDIPFKGE
jgi:hypothetical protein